jgi:hypothetical protein
MTAQRLTPSVVRDFYFFFVDEAIRKYLDFGGRLHTLAQ